MVRIFVKFSRPDYENFIEESQNVASFIPATATAVCVTDCGRRSNYMPQPMTVHTDSGPYGHAAIRSPSLHPRNAIAWITTHLHTPEGGKAELAFALFADP